MQIIGRRVLVSIDCDNRAVSEAAHNRHRGVIDVFEMLAKDGNLESDCGSLAATFGESIFYSNGQQDPDGLEDCDIDVDLGEDPPEAIKKELEIRVQ